MFGRFVDVLRVDAGVLGNWRSSGIPLGGRLFRHVPGVLQRKSESDGSVLDRSSDMPRGRYLGERLLESRVGAFAGGQRFADAGLFAGKDFGDDALFLLP